MNNLDNFSDSPKLKMLEAAEAACKHDADSLLIGGLEDFDTIEIRTLLLSIENLFDIYAGDYFYYLDEHIRQGKNIHPDYRNTIFPSKS